MPFRTDNTLECTPVKARNGLWPAGLLRFSGSARSVGPMLRVALHRLILAVTLIAFTGGMTLQLMPPKAAFAASAATPVASDCAKMAMMPADNGAGHAMPCKGMDSECVKQMRCLGTPSLPLRLGDNFVHFAYGKVAYWTPANSRDGRSIKPDLFPPIGL